jgi:hypothetical protein
MAGVTVKLNYLKELTADFKQLQRRTIDPTATPFNPVVSGVQRGFMEKYTMVLLV